MEIFSGKVWSTSGVVFCERVLIIFDLTVFSLSKLFFEIFSCQYFLICSITCLIFSIHGFIWFFLENILSRDNLTIDAHFLKALERLGDKLSSTLCKLGSSSNGLETKAWKDEQNFMFSGRCSVWLWRSTTVSWWKHHIMSNVCAFFVCSCSQKKF